MSIGYDNHPLNQGLLLDLAFEESSGLITKDIAKPVHDPVTLVGPPAWTTLATGYPALNYDGAGDYLECLAALTADMDFTDDDYSIAGLINPIDTAGAEVIIGRYGLDLDGWELYLFGGLLNLRHHHASLGADTRDSCYSSGWAYGEHQLFGISRSGLYPMMTKNGQPVEVTYDGGGVKDPDSCNRDMVIGARYTKNTNWYKGIMSRLWVWGRALLSFEWLELFHIVRGTVGI